MIGRSLGGALEALLHACAGDDLRPVSEPERRAYPAMLVPEGLDPLVELLELGGHIGVAAFREAMPELDAAVAQPFDLVSDVLKCAHVQDKRETGPPYSALTSPTTSGTFVTSG